MTKEEAQKLSQDKLEKINQFLQSMKVFPEAKQKLSRAGYLEHVVVFTDMEEYKIDPPAKPVVRGPNEENKNVENTPAQ